MRLQPGRKLFEQACEDLARATGKKPWSAGWEGLTAAERAMWNEHAAMIEAKDRDEQEF